MGGITLTEEVKKDLECPVCFEIPKEGPIYQCNQGHIHCKECRPKLKDCPVCRGNLGGSRNLMLEKIISRLILPCDFKHLGCSMVGQNTELQDHRKTCCFKPVEPKDKSIDQNTKDDRENGTDSDYTSDTENFTENDSENNFSESEAESEDQESELEHSENESDSESDDIDETENETDEENLESENDDQESESEFENSATERDSESEEENESDEENSESETNDESDSESDSSSENEAENSDHETDYESDNYDSDSDAENSENDDESEESDGNDSSESDSENEKDDDQWKAPHRAPKRSLDHLADPNSKRQKFNLKCNQEIRKPILINGKMGLLILNKAFYPIYIIVIHSLQDLILHKIFVKICPAV